MKKSKNASGEKNGTKPALPTPPVENDFPTVGIGASAGGLGALQTFLQEIPPDTGAAYVVIVHLEPAHTSELAEILARKAHIPVQQVNRKMQLRPDNIYVIPPNRRLVMTDHHIDAMAFQDPHGRRSPIDQFFRSLADQHGDGFAVVLTGAGSDGALGSKAIKEAGGLILVQDPDEAEYPSMPRSAIATGCADLILPVKELGRQLVELIRTKAHISLENFLGGEEETIRGILAHLRSKTGHDFTRYKRSTTYRRIARRMQVRKVELSSEYLALLKRKPEEVESLFHDLLISVTTFFRDPQAFAVLAQKVIPNLYVTGEPAGALRIWVPGCATGEEAYSIAMLFAEEGARHETKRDVQIFASDLDGVALAIAREGRYPLAIEADVSEERLRKYFTGEGDHYRIRREIREMVLFATHSLLKDPPFSKLHLVSCRNLLIYLERELQQQVLATINYALTAGGYLFLGSSETADTAQSYFRVFDRESKIYRSNGPAGEHRDLPHLNMLPRAPAFPDPGIAVPSGFSPLAMHQRALELTAPPSMLVDASHQVVHMSEAAGRFVQPSGGQIRNDATELVRPELRFDLRAALHLAFERNEPSLSLAIPVQFNGAPHRVFLQVRPVASSDGGHRQAAVFFIEGDALVELVGDSVEVERDQATQSTIRGLKEELELTRSRLRSSREEFEGANEELRAANEEMQSVNEEYRSTAEELETSKEELQSINEELQTVNAELKIKLDGVSRANNDMQNLMAATEVGTLFLDSQLRIKRFTPAITELFNIKAPDEGRSITDFTHRLDYPTFIEDARTVLKERTVIEREIESNGNWYLTRLRPYRTTDDHIEGVVCTFVDVTSRLKTEEALRASEARLRLLLSELSHRVKNTLAVVQSMARQSFGGDVSREEGLEIFSNRLRALAEAHNLLVSTDWAGADFRALAERQIGPYAKLDGNTVSLEGPPVSLPPDIATPLALVLHELATNALKYGALSSPSGTLRLEWGFRPDGAGRDFQFTWRESGGPKVERPSKEGFGSWLIRNGLPEATVELDYIPDGAVCTVTMPAESLKIA